MHPIAAELRHYELTQHLYDLGDEVADYVEHVLQAIADWDVELVEDCLAELHDIVAEDRRDAWAASCELAGLRQALTSGLLAGTISWRSAPRTVEEPEKLTAKFISESYPLSASPLKASELHDTLQSRAQLVQSHLGHMVEWVLDSTNFVANNLRSASLSAVFQRVEDKTRAAAESWLECVASNTAYTRSMRGSNPPEFLSERAWADAIAYSVWDSQGRCYGS